jgi:hypothetical protein
LVEGRAESARQTRTIIQFLSNSFDFCSQAIPDMTLEKLDAVVSPPNRKMTGLEWLWAYFTDTQRIMREIDDC